MNITNNIEDDLMRTSKRPIKSATTGKKLVDDLKPFGKLIQTTYRQDSLLSKSQLAKFSQTSRVMLGAIQNKVDTKLVQRPLDMTAITYHHDRRLMQLMVMLPSGERYRVYEFVEKLNQLLLGEITEEIFYQYQQPKIFEKNSPKNIGDKTKRANQTLKQRLRQLTESKLQLTQQYQQLKVALAQKEMVLREQMLLNQELTQKLQILCETNATYQFKIKKQQ